MKVDRMSFLHVVIVLANRCQQRSLLPFLLILLDPERLVGACYGHAQGQNASSRGLVFFFCSAAGTWETSLLGGLLL